MSDQMLLVELSMDWADEFTVNGFRVMTESQWEDHKRLVRKKKEDSHIEVYFGTNEALEWEGAEEYIDSFSITEITDEEADVLKRFFGQGDVIEGGTFPMFESYDDDDEDLDDEEDETLGFGEDDPT
jgi:hypothetical protein